MRVFRLSTWFAVGSVFLLSACASMYSVRPVVAENQVPVQNQGFESLSSKKKHIVQVGSVQNSIRQFDNPRFNVTFVNQGKFPVEFSTENVSVTFNGQAAQVAGAQGGPGRHDERDGHRQGQQADRAGAPADRLLAEQRGADGAGPILLATAPQIAAGESQEDRRPPRLSALALNRQEHFLGRIGHRPDAHSS